MMNEISMMELYYKNNYYILLVVNTLQTIGFFMKTLYKNDKYMALPANPKTKHCRRKNQC